MNNTDEKVIELSKTKILFLITIACGFVVGGLWMLQLDSAEIAAQRRFNNPILVHGIGVVSIAFFGLCGLFGVKKIFDKKPGLILSAAGIFDNSSGVSAGLVPWSEILGFDIFEVQKQKTLIVKIAKPERYIERGGFAKRALNRMNYKLCGSPIAITSNSLKIDFDELHNVCNAYFKKYGKNA
ncbi:STM3941 family protein [Undibacterium flavidum]|uniref:Uncharacterized protein n=1 Tax=Undibacterium flavidum TaxID=2762297 RepID=A0ABR6YBF8_9BURK|nr:STM3941 family protein [Undibacterium flavidum]MBC3873970.1 hypothetical protein [Undibacterium flavidum]